MTIIAQPDPLEGMSAALADVMRARGDTISSHEAREMIEQVVRPEAPDAVTENDRDVLTRFTSLSDDDLTPEALHASDARLAAAQIDIANEVWRDSLTTERVAGLLDTTTAYVRRLASQGDLYSAGKRRRTLMFPAWQFVDGHRLPHLREVLAALPENYHPLSVTTFMTEALDTLDTRSPLEWLAGGGDPSPVVAAADERSRV